MPQSVDDNNHLPTYSTPASERRIADLLADVKDDSGYFFKYIPDSMLSEEKHGDI